MVILGLTTLWLVSHPPVALAGILVGLALFMVIAVAGVVGVLRLVAGLDRRRQVSGRLDRES